MKQVTKDKLSFVPFNLFFSLTTFMMMQMFLQNIIGLNWWKSAVFAFIFYLYDALNSAKMDYFESEINKLKNK